MNENTTARAARAIPRPLAIDGWDVDELPFPTAEEARTRFLDAIVELLGHPTIRLVGIDLDHLVRHLQPLAPAGDVSILT